MELWISSVMCFSTLKTSMMYIFAPLKDWGNIFINWWWFFFFFRLFDVANRNFCCCWTACAASSESLTFVRTSSLFNWLICSCSTFQIWSPLSAVQDIYDPNLCQILQKYASQAVSLCSTYCEFLRAWPSCPFQGFSNCFCMRQAEVPRCVAVKPVYLQ